jgi:hypothetical protein
MFTFDSYDLAFEWFCNFLVPDIDISIRAQMMMSSTFDS